MENNSLISVLMPVHNGASTIERAVKSLKLQSYHNWKVIIVDDGSIDETKNILKKYMNDPQIKVVFHETNKGRGAARQTALENAEGGFIAFLDADDFYHPDKLHLQMKTFIENPNISLVGCSLMSFNKENCFKVRGSGDGSIKKHLPDTPIKFVAAASMIKRQDIAGERYNVKLNASEDVDFLERILVNKKYILLSDILYYYEQDIGFNRLKMIEYYKNTLKKYYTNVKINKFLSIVDFGKSFMKLIVVRILLLFNRTDILLSRRGGNASDQEISKYFNTLKNINFII